MNGWLGALGVGAVLAYLALPLLAFTQRGNRRADPQSRQGPLIAVLALAASLIALPLLPLGATADGSGATTATAGTWERITALPEHATLPLSPIAIAGAVWAALAAVGLGRLAFEAAMIRWVVRRARPAPAELIEKLAELASELSVPVPRLLVTDMAAVPLVVPGRRAAVVLPPYALERLSPEALELALRHELTHLARGDHRVAMVGAVLSALFTLHPTARKIDRELALAREEAVDHRVAGGDPKPYASALLDVAGLRPKHRALTSLGMSESALSMRIASLEDPRPRPLARIAPLIGLGLIVAAIGLAVPTPKVAPQEEPQVAGSIAVVLAPGDQRVLYMPELARLSVGDPSIADVRSLGDGQVLVIGHEEGSTSLLSWTKTGERQSWLIRVRKH